MRINHPLTKRRLTGNLNRKQENDSKCRITTKQAYRPVRLFLKTREKRGNTMIRIAKESDCLP